AYLNGEIVEAIRFPFRFKGELVLDFGRKLTGKTYVQADGDLDFTYGSDWEQLRHIQAMEGERTTIYWVHETYECACPWGRVIATQNHPSPIEAGISVFRLLCFSSEVETVIHDCWLDFSAPHLPLTGEFRCNDEELEKIWQMGVYTTLLSTQDNCHALVPVPAPGSGYVIWDGPRRDREVWGGDLRPASLTWLSAYEDPEPVANSLYMLWQGRHVGCSDSGMVPGSGSSHQTFFEWTFWFLVNSWEYYEWTGDRQFLKCLCGTAGLDLTLEWVKNKLNENGLVLATNSWMYTLKLEGELCALAMVQVAGLEALAKLFRVGGKNDLAEEALELAKQTRRVIPQRFFDKKFGAYRMRPEGAQNISRYPLDANSWAILYGIGDSEMIEGCSQFLDSDGIKEHAGLRCFWPLFDKSDGDWFVADQTSWFHNETIWPYPNGYASWAKFHLGEIDRGLDILRAFNRAHIAAGHATLWEAMMPDGQTPIRTHGNLASLCHAWGGTAGFLLPRYILGIAPEGIAFESVRINPNLGSLGFASGTIPTPKGTIQVEVEKKGADLKGKAVLPKGVQIQSCPEEIEIISPSLKKTTGVLTSVIND
ncbi:MAG: hypothetical protein KC964_11560, partial [Candidatus Omnitrophica bacterium]|nr:hypothetical protein [Candidatus Omnitrophota bacterium]